MISRVGADKFYAARLVEETRLHLSVIMQGEYSEQFFYCFFQIIAKEIYLGYYAFNGKNVKLKGIIDFLFNKHYGLGIKGLDSFMLALADAVPKDKTKSQYARQIVKWLGTQSPKLKFPRRVFEYERLINYLRLRNKIKKVSQKEINLLVWIYNAHSEHLHRVGEKREFETFEALAVELGLISKTKKTTIVFDEEMTPIQLERASTKIISTLDKAKVLSFVNIVLTKLENDELS